MKSILSGAAKRLNTGLLRLLIIQLVIGAPASHAADLDLETALSQKLVSDLTLHKLFDGGQIFSQLRGAKFEFMDQTLNLAVSRPHDGAVDLEIDKNLNLLVAKKSAGNWFIGGTGKVFLREMDLKERINRADFRFNFVNHKVGDEVVPALHVVIDDASFKIIQKGEVKIKKHVAFFSWADSKNFKGVFKGLKFNGLYQLKRVTETGKNGENVQRIGLKLLDHSAKIQSREFDGGGVPKDKFLSQYSERIENVFGRMLAKGFENTNGISAGEGAKTSNDLVFQRALTDILVAGQTSEIAEEKKIRHLGMDHRLRITATTSFVTDACADGVTAPQAEDTPPRAQLFEHDLNIRSLRSHVPFSYIEHLAYFGARAGKFCLSSPDGVGGTIAFVPTGAIDVGRVDEETIKIVMNLDYVHRNAALPGGEATGTLKVIREAKIVAVHDSTGKTTSLTLTGTKDDVRGNVAYRTGLEVLLKVVPLEIPLPVLTALPPYVPHFKSAKTTNRHFLIEYEMVVPK